MNKNINYFNIFIYLSVITIICTKIFLKCHFFIRYKNCNIKFVRKYLIY